ncbi:ATP/GTP-binding protein, partial [Streptomyces mirabilis]
GAAVADEAQRRWDKRRAEAKDKAARDGDGKAPGPDTETKDSKESKGSKGGGGDKDADATRKKMPKDGPEPAADGPEAAKEPEDDRKDSEKPSDGSEKSGAKSDDDKRSFKERVKDRFGKSGTAPGSAPGTEEPPRRARPEDFKVTVDSPGRSSRPPKPEPAEEEIPDAVIVDDPSDPFGATVSSTASLPRAPESHTQRPGTTRPTTQEDPVASEVNKPTSVGQAGMAAKHRTDITFGEYLVEIVNIAIAAGLDKDRAQDLAVALGKVADALRDMAADLVGDHNVATEVVDQISDLADAAARMKQLAERCATECEIASEAARLAAMSVGRVYGEDIRAMDDAGLAHASAAAHHD